MYWLIPVLLVLLIVIFIARRARKRPVDFDIQRENMRSLYGDNTK